MCKHGLDKDIQNTHTVNLLSMDPLVLGAKQLVNAARRSPDGFTMELNPQALQPEEEHRGQILL